MIRESQESKAKSVVETWAGNFGTVQDRKRGRRTIKFDGDLFDTVDHVSLCLGVIPDIADLMAEGCREDRRSGFYKHVELITEAAQQTLRAVFKENQELKSQLKTLRESKVEKQVISLPLTGTPTKFDVLSLKYFTMYGDCKAHALGLILVDMFHPGAREHLIGMVAGGKSVDEIKAQVGRHEMCEQDIDDQAAVQTKPDTVELEHNPNQQVVTG